MPSASSGSRAVPNAYAATMDSCSAEAAIPPGYTTGEPDLGVGSIWKSEPDEIAFQIEAPRAGLVVLNEIMFPGWTVRVDGELSPAVRANYLLRAVLVPPGVHQITWRFEP